MTTTPAPNDLDELTALLADATTEGPWGVSELRHDDKWVVFGGADAYSVGTVWSRTDADLIAAMRNALPALLDELAEAKREIRTLTETDDAQVVIAQGERDAAREELAKTRADVEKLTTALDIVALREIRQAAELAIVERERDRLRDSVQRARQEIAALRAAAEANPATTAEPADEPKADDEPCCSDHNWNDLCSFVRFKHNACCGDCPDWNTPAEPAAS